MAIKIGVVGIGTMGLHHVRNFYHHPEVELVAVVDPSEDRLKQVIEKFPVQGYTNFKDIIDRVDAVSIATPTSTHFSLAKEFIKNKKHVLLEKPICEEIDEAKILIDLAENYQVLFAVGHIERFNPVMQELENILRANKPVYIDIHRESPYDPRIFDADVISDLMIHDVDLLLYLLNERITLKSAYGISVHSSRNDLVSAQFISESGILINVTTSRTTEQKIRQWNLTLPNQFIQADLMERKLYITRRTNGSLEIFHNNSEVKYKQEQLIEKVLVANYEPLQMEIFDFIQAITKGRRPKVQGKEGLKALEITKEIQLKVKETCINRKII
ncbi:Gfo/Idh/MocA family protein [Paenibacillus elgii]|uniref:Gfo/Idh/MocA family protein n=1 Tax=Paenibacillus elgii TaxID=189691 RepID=UPI000248C3F4|nr:Gfo/Idh/MocA family oxidoreductase [Paenibacillus elgii]